MIESDNETGKIALLIFVTYVQGRLVCCGLGQKWVTLGWGNCLKYFKRGWSRKEGQRSKDFKKEGAVEFRVNQQAWKNCDFFKIRNISGR